MILDLIANGGEGIAVRELAAKMRLPRSVVQRLLYTLEANGFLERHPSQVGYRLAIKLWGLGCASIRGLSMRDIARPHLEEIARKTNEVAKLGVLDGAEVVYIDKVDCPQVVRAYVPIGGRAPANLVATGKAILAFLPAKRSVAPDKSTRKVAGKTVAKQLSAGELEQIRRRGYAINRGDWEADVGAIAAPIFGAEGEVQASIGIILPSHRLTAVRATRMGNMIKAAAAEISRKLGYQRGDNILPLKRIG